MPDYACVIQEGQTADRRRSELAEGLKKIGQEAFGDDPTQTSISWVVVKKGFAWTARALGPGGAVAGPPGGLHEQGL
jgi:hypothetical protein